MVLAGVYRPGISAATEAETLGGRTGEQARLMAKGLANNGQEVLQGSVNYIAARIAHLK
jgi:hypothetical protein